MEYISREDYCEENCGKENREGYKTCKNCGMLNIPTADVQPTEKFEEYRSLLEECERKLSYLFECEIESTWESQKVKELIAKIQSCIQNNKE